MALLDDADFVVDERKLEERDNLFLHELRRDGAGGLLIERTVKEVVVTASGDVELWPRSHNPKWSKPVPLHGGTKPGEELTVEIAGLVIGAYLQA